MAFIVHAALSATSYIILLSPFSYSHATKEIAYAVEGCIHLLQRPNIARVIIIPVTYNIEVDVTKASTPGPPRHGIR